LLVALLLSGWLTFGPTACARAPYRPPVVAVVVDGFRLPNGPYGAGNRGIEYRTRPGQAVSVIGAGVVVFAGPVAGARFVTVLHPDGLLSSYSYLERLEVGVGEVLAAGRRIGTATDRLQLGIRRDGVYIDPAPLLGAALRVRLVGPSVGPADVHCLGPAPA